MNKSAAHFAHDLAWNLNYRTNNGSLSTFIVDNKNELTNAFSILNSYDSNGNLTGVGSGKVYVYDDENQLIQWFSYQLGSSSPTNGDLRTDFVYDGLGRLRERLEYTLSCPATNGGGGGDQSALLGAQLDSLGNGCTWSLTNEDLYVYDGWRVIQERDSNNVPQVSYTRGNDLSMSLEGAGGIGGLLARTRYFAGSPTSPGLYFSDGNGNITYLLATNQTMLASYRYDPFGNIISKSGSLADANVYRFSSKEVHVNSGMYYYGFRFYDPNLQRWINRDPIEEEGGFNLYRSFQNSPLRFVDILGFDCWSCSVTAFLGCPHGVVVGDDGNGGSYTFEYGPKNGGLNRIYGPGKYSYTHYKSLTPSQLLGYDLKDRNRTRTTAAMDKQLNNFAESLGANISTPNYFFAGNNCMTSAPQINNIAHNLTTYGTTYVELYSVVNAPPARITAH